MYSLTCFIAFLSAVYLIFLHATYTRQLVLLASSIGNIFNSLCTPLGLRLVRKLVQYYSAGRRMTIVEVNVLLQAAHEMRAYFSFFFPLFPHVTISGSNSVSNSVFSPIIRAGTRVNVEQVRSITHKSLRARLIPPILRIARTPGA